ncbi:MAG: ribonuclease P protein component [Alphaproteobacteria bacterium]|nr:ribonuclease P protein component [Alphaproteobacteria bacterium]
MASPRPDITRIKKRKHFVAAASKGNKVVATTLVLQGYPTPVPAKALSAADYDTNIPPPIRVGFTVTKRVGNAVIRNRVRRRLKAAADQLLLEHGLSGWDYIIIGRAKAINEEFDIILRDMRYAIRKVAKIEEAKQS